MAIAWSKTFFLFVLISLGIKTIGFCNKFMISINDLSIDIITLEKSYDWIEHEEIEITEGKDDYKKDQRHLAIDLSAVNMIGGDGNYLLKDMSMQVRDCERVGILGENLFNNIKR